MLILMMNETIEASYERRNDVEPRATWLLHQGNEPDTSTDRTLRIHQIDTMPSFGDTSN